MVETPYMGMGLGLYVILIEELLGFIMAVYINIERERRTLYRCAYMYICVNTCVDTYIRVYVYIYIYIYMFVFYWLFTLNDSRLRCGLKNLSGVGPRAQRKMY